METSVAATEASLDEGHAMPPPVQQWTLKPSPRKERQSLDEQLEPSFEVEVSEDRIETLQDDSLGVDGQLSPASLRLTTASTPRRRSTGGILRAPDTPGTGQSVRFGKRLYDDGDESKMSESSTSSGNNFLVQGRMDGHSSQGNLTAEDLRARWTSADDSSEAVDMSLPSIKGSRLLASTGDGSLQSLLNMPTIEDYSNLLDDEEEPSLNESMLRREVERAKKALYGDEMVDDQPQASSSQLTEKEPASEGAHTLQAPDESNSIFSQNTPSTHYRTAFSRASTRSPLSTSSRNFNTPRSDFSHDESQAGPSVTKEPTHLSHFDHDNSMSTSALSIPWKGDDDTHLESPSIARVSRLEASSMSMSGIMLPGGLSRRFRTTLAPSTPLSTRKAAVSKPTENQTFKSAEVRRESTTGNEVQRMNTSPEVAPSVTPVTQPANTFCINDVVRATQELDQAHLERTEMLLKRIKLAEKDADTARQAVLQEKEEAERARTEADTLRAALSVLQSETKESKKMSQDRKQEVENLMAKLEVQLNRRAQGSAIISSDQEGKNHTEAHGGEQAEGSMGAHRDTVKMDLVEKQALDVKAGDLSESAQEQFQSGGKVDEERSIDKASETRSDEEIADLKYETYHLRSEVDRLASQLEEEKMKAQQMLEEKEAAIDLLKEQVTELKESAEEVQARRYLATEGMDSLEASLLEESTHAQDNAQDKAEYDAKDAELSEAKAAIIKLEDAKAADGKALLEFEERSRALQGELDAALSEATSLESALKAAMTTLEDERKSFEDQMTSLKDLNDLNRNQQSEAGTLRSELSEALAIIASLEAEKVVTADALRECGVRIQDLQENLGTANQRTEQLEASMNATRSGMEGERHSFEAQLISLVEKHEIVLKEQEEAYIAEIQALTNEGRSKEACIQELELDLSEHKQQRAGLENQCAGLQESLSGAQRRIVELQLEGSTMNKGIEAVRQDLDDVQSQLNYARNRLASAEGEKNVLEQERNDLLVKVTELDHQVADKEEEKSALEEERNALLIEATESKHRMHDQEVELVEMRQKMEKAQEEYATVTRKSDDLVAPLTEVGVQQRSDLPPQKRMPSEERRQEEEVKRTSVNESAPTVRERIERLEREVRNRGIEIARLQKSKDRLEQKNQKFGIVLASKQQEINYLQRQSADHAGAKADVTPKKAISVASRMQTFSTIRRLPFQDVLNKDTIVHGGVNDSTLPALEPGPAHLKAVRRKTMDGFAAGRADERYGAHEMNKSTSPTGSPPKHILEHSHLAGRRLARLPSGKVDEPRRTSHSSSSSTSTLRAGKTAPSPVPSMSSVDSFASTASSAASLAALTKDAANETEDEVHEQTARARARDSTDRDASSTHMLSRISERTDSSRMSSWKGQMSDEQRLRDIERNRMRRERDRQSDRERRRPASRQALPA